MQEVLISDGTGTLSLVFFNQPFIADEKYPNALVPGRRGLFSGKVKLYKGMRQLAHPQHQMFTEEGQEPPDPEVDPEGAKRVGGDPAARSTRRRRRSPPGRSRRRSSSRSTGIAGLDDPMPLEVCRTAQLMGYEAALRRIHRPAHDGDWVQAKRTLRFHEAFLLQTALLQRRAVRAMFAATPRVPAPGGYLARFDAVLPFELTADQRTVGAEIMADLAGRRPDAPPAPGGGRLRQDPRRAAGDARGRRVRRPVGAARARRRCWPRSTCAPSPAILGPDLSAELMPTLVTGQMGGRSPSEGGAADHHRPREDRRRHARAAVGHDRVRGPRARRRRRAAPVRRRAAGGAAPQGIRPAHPGDDGDPDPAHRRDDGLRRPRDLHDPRPARGARADHLPRRAARGEAALAAERVAARGRGDRAGPSGLRASARRSASTRTRATCDAAEDGAVPRATVTGVTRGSAHAAGPRRPAHRGAHRADVRRREGGA